MTLFRTANRACVARLNRASPQADEKLHQKQSAGCARENNGPVGPAPKQVLKADSTTVVSQALRNLRSPNEDDACAAETFSRLIFASSCDC